MTPKTLLAFSIVTAGLVVAAAVSVANRPAATVIPKDRPFVFGGLDEKLNDAFSVEIQTAQRKFTVQRLLLFLTSPASSANSIRKSG